MAITVVKDYTFPFAKNDDYIYLSSDKTEEQQFRYGLHYLYEEAGCELVDNQIADGYIQFQGTSSFSEIYNIGDLIYWNINGNFIQYNPVPLLITNIQVLSADDYKVYFDVDKLIKDSYWFYYGLTNSSSKDNDSTIYKCVTKKVAANSDGYGVFSVNDINRQLLDDNIINISSNDYTSKFKYLPFEEYLYVLDYDATTIASSSSQNIFKVNAVDLALDKYSFAPNDNVIVKDDSNSFYNGVQNCLGFNGAGGDWYFTTNKPALNGISLSGGKMYRADYESTPLTDENLISAEKTSFLSGLKYNDISGLNDTELNTLITSYTDSSKYFSYAPKEQSTYLDDLGYLTIANNGLSTVTYTVTDSEGIEHLYTLDLLYPFYYDVYKVPSNPALINDTNMTTNAARGLPVIQDCDKSYTITSLNTETYKFNLLQDNKFMRVRLLFADSLGSLNGFNFALYNARTIKTTKDTFTKDINDFSSLNTIKFNNQSRGKTDIATNISYKLKLNSDFLTQDEGNYFEDLLTSNNVYAQYKGDIIAVNISSNSVTIKEKVNGLIRYSLEVEYSINRTKW